MSAQRVALALCLVALAACGGVSLRPDGNACVLAEHHVAPDGLCEDVHACARPPGGPFDRVGLRRLAPCDGTSRGPVVVYLPGMHMNGLLPRDPAAFDLRRDLAAHGLRVWSIDYRTHAVPASAAPAALATMTSWTADLFADDARAAIAFVRRTDPGEVDLMGFSYGAGLAYRLVAGGEPVDGLVILDGMPPDGRAAADGSDPAIDVGGSRLPWAERERLLAAVLDDPSGPSPLPGFATAGQALTTIVHGARAFGGQGGLSAVQSGRTDVRALAGLLALYDRWWPRAALHGARVDAGNRSVRLLAFSSTTIGDAWVARVRAGADAFGGPAATVRVLPGYGHVDVLVARDAPILVAEPVRRFLTGQP